MRPQILYHSPCPDGMAAALAAYLRFGDDADYHPVTYSAPAPAVPDGCHVYLLDVCLPLAELEALAARSVGVLVLDHHATSRDALAGVTAHVGSEPPVGLSACFDMNRSGAVIAWEYFHAGYPLPPMFAWVQDRDLWRFALPETRAFGAYMQVQEMSLTSYRAIYQCLYGQGQNAAHWTAHMLDQGDTMLKAQAQFVERLCASAFWVTIAGHKVPVANAAILQSEVGEALLAKYPEAPFAAIYYQNADKQVWSLRARPDGDVAAIALQFGGGGHKAAAGFTIPVQSSRPELTSASH